MSQTEAPKRRKPSDVAMAEHRAWKIGWRAAQDITDDLVQVRHNLLTQGFPDAHALCEDIDADARKWAAHAEQMRRDMIRHAEENMIQL